MRVGVNLLRFDPDTNIGGNYTYAYNILKYMILDRRKEYVLLVTEKNKKMFEFGEDNVKYVTGTSKNNIFSQIVYENVFIDKQVKNNHVDVFYSPCFLLPFKKLYIPSIATIHDINFKHFSQGRLKDIYKNIIYKKTLEQADRLTTVSEFTKEDLCSHFGPHQHKIDVVYNGCDFIRDKIYGKDADSLKKEYNIHSKYLLCISHYSHKNARIAIRAFAMIRNKLNEKYALVITGAKGTLKSELIELSKTLDVLDSIIFIDYVQSKYMKELYQRASLFLFPSLFEGFGIPVLEAMNMGCPVIASNCASIPEVVGNAGMTIDANDAYMWGEKILYLLNDKEAYDHYRKMGFERARAFNWKNSAEKLSLILERLYNEFSGGIYEEKAINHV